MKKLLFSLGAILLFGEIQGQISARLMRFPDVSDNQIVFSYGNDIWIVGKKGGTAIKLSSPNGQETFPKFSPDGSQIAFTANYEGNSEVYAIPTVGGIPQRLTYHGMSDQVVDWADNESVLFRSRRESGKQRFSQFYTILTEGGSSKKLAVPYGEFASYSPDGTLLAFTDKSRVGRTWKRYEGGMASDIHIFNLETFETENITNNKANDEIPMWGGNSIYFLSDRGTAKRYNIWKYDISTKQVSQLTNFTDFDVHYPSIGPKEIVFQAGDRLYLLNLQSEAYDPVDITIISDQQYLIPMRKNVNSYLQSATISPDGNRVVAQARGELFNLPASEGFVSNISQTSGVAERYPSWSPDGRHLAYWSDASGEYQLVLRNMSNGNARTVTSFTNGFRYSIQWSPDSKKLAYVNQAMKIQYINVDDNSVNDVDQGLYMYEGGLQNFKVSWSADSRWMAYSKGQPSKINAIFVFDTESKKVTQLISGFYNDDNPVFSADGKYLFYTTNRRLSPNYSDLDNTFIYPNATQLAVAPLSAGTESILKVKNDEVEIKEEKEESKEDSKKGKGKKDKDEKTSDKEEEVKIEIDLVGFENRAEIIQGVYGNMGNLSVAKGKLIFSHFPNTGANNDENPSLKYYDIEDREFKTIISNVANYEISGNGEKLLVSQKGELAVIDISEGAEIDKKVPTSEMSMYVIPKEEWNQIFTDVWRLERDYFYDENMHGVDWNLMKKRYGDLVDQANSREDLNFILGELIGELNASHTYRGGGDQENAKRAQVGYLGANFRVTNGEYQVETIINGADWDAEVRSPLNQPGVDVNVGDYILAVNSQLVDTSRPIHAWFQGLAGKSVELTVNSTASMSGARKALVKPLRSETRLRHLDWINTNRKRVDEATGGKIGYVYVPSTDVGGQTELIRQYYGQLDKEGMIIDERFNNGGQIPDRFIEILDRKPLAFWAVRDGRDWEWPPVSNFGPKVMMINGFSDSGGDAFPDYFKKAGLGTLVGMRTWGGLIGISGAPGLIDNGRVTVPTFRMYDPDGEWFKEGYGVNPDIEVPQDFQKLANGTDAQLEAAITEVLRLLSSPGVFKQPAHPAYENRND